MKRIDVLKSVEQILIEKAYETGHISHRADGDWQKQADGSWIPYTGQSDQSTPQTQKPTKNTEYDEITEEDLAETPNDTIYSTEDITTTRIDGEDAYEIAGTPIIAVKDPTGKWQVMDGDKIVADGLNTALAHETMVKTMNDKHGFGDEHSGIIKQDFESVPNSIKDKMFTIAQQYQSEWAEDGDEDVRSMAENDVEDISQMLWDNADEETRNSWIGSEDSNAPIVEKSAVRDMRSVPTTKNMGF